MTNNYKGINSNAHSEHKDSKKSINGKLIQFYNSVTIHQSTAGNIQTIAGVCYHISFPLEQPFSEAKT